MNFYKILQVTEDAEPEVIEAAYRRLSTKYHPDRNHSPNAETRMKELNEAYSVLGDPIRRREYDQWLKQQNDPESDSTLSTGFGWIDTALKVATAVNESLGTPCPQCGTKSLIHQKKLGKSVWDYITGSQKYQCRNCGKIYSL